MQRKYVLHRTRCAQEDDQVLHEGRKCRVYAGSLPATRCNLDRWMKMPWTAAMEVTRPSLISFVKCVVRDKFHFAGGLPLI
jgi:hypothetical protein